MQVGPNETLLIPAGGMNTTEANVAKNDQVLLTVGSREVEGFRAPGTGFLIKGSAAFLKAGSKLEAIKQRFPWARAAVEITITSTTQTL